MATVGISAALPPLPADDSLVALGQILVRHSLLDFQLKLMVRLIASTPASEPFDELDKLTSAELRERVEKLAKKRFAKDPGVIKKLKALLTQAKKLTKDRNQYVHWVWATTATGEPKLLGRGKLHEVPTAEQLDKLGRDIFTVTALIHEMRTRGLVNDTIKAETAKKWFT